MLTLPFVKAMWFNYMAEHLYPGLTCIGSTKILEQF